MNLTDVHIPWFQVACHFVWILGAALILASFGYHDWLAREKGQKLGPLLRRKSFLRALTGGGTMIFGALALLIRSPVLTVVFAASAILIGYKFVQIHRK